MTNGIVQATLSSAVLLLPLAAFSAENCGKFKLNNTTQCKSIVASFDLSACGEGEALIKAQVDCLSPHFAKAIAKTAHATYQVELKSDPNWGDTWLVDGSIKSGSRKERRHIARAESIQTKIVQPAARQPAGDTAEPLASPSTTPAAPETPWSFSGYLDTYYSYNFNHPQPVRPISGSTTPTAAAIPPGNNLLRLYDIYANQISLNLAELTVKKTGKEVSALIDLDFGQEADLNAAAASASGYTVDEVSKHVGQAYLTITPASAPGLIIDIGKMYTHLGLETAKAKDNWQYSRSVLYSFGIPIWHTGVHVGYSLVPDRLSVSGYIYNGWNTIYDNNSGKTFGAQLKWTPSDASTVVYNYIGGPEQPNNNAIRKTVHEANASYVFNPRLSVGADLLAGMEGDSKWQAYTIAAKYQALPWYSISPRGEFYRDPQGFTLGNPQDVYSFTLTNAFSLLPGLESRFEIRRDISTSALAFLSSDGTSGNQTTALISFLYVF